MNPTPFQIAKSVGDQFGELREERRDTSAIDEILEEAAKSNDPDAATTKAMGQILSRVSAEKRPAALKILESKTAQLKIKQQQDADVKLGFPKEFSLASPQAQKIFGEQLAARSKEGQKGAGKEGALQVVDKMRELRAKGNLGFSPLASAGVGRLSTKEVQADRGEYEQLGKSLISFATNIPIRNRLEFETLAEKLFNPSLSDGEAKGVLDAMERILSVSSNIQEREGIPQQAGEKQPTKSLADIWGS